VTLCGANAKAVGRHRKSFLVAGLDNLQQGNLVEARPGDMAFAISSSMLTHPCESSVKPIASGLWRRT
jgi:hypothetical protein